MAAMLLGGAGTHKSSQISTATRARPASKIWCVPKGTSAPPTVMLSLPAMAVMLLVVNQRFS